MIYVDELLLVNFAIAAGLLLAAGLLAGQRCSGGRLLLGSGAAALSALILLAPALPFGWALGYRAASGAAAVALVYGWPGRRAFLRLGAWYLLLNLLLTGAAVLVPVGGIQAANLAVYLPVSPGRLLFCTAAVYLALRVLLACMGHPGQGCVPARLEIGGAELEVNLFCDTGFTVQDTAGGRTVILVRYSKVRDALPAALQKGLEGQLTEKGCADPPDPELKMRFLPCRTIAGRKLLPAVPAQSLTVEQRGKQRRLEELLAAFCPGDEEEDWSVLIGAEAASQLGI